MEKYDFVVWVSCVAYVSYVALATQHTERDIQKTTHKAQKTKRKIQVASCETELTGRKVLFITSYFAFFLLQCTKYQFFH